MAYFCEFGMGNDIKTTDYNSKIGKLDFTNLKTFALLVVELEK